jgi:formylglycine-generating enzyme required for sulfatase activity/tRNA A-37 threonylcarbamoyl transferase component Bud32/dienelactone hydrolase
MNCVKCQTPIPEDARYCSKCGTPAGSSDETATLTMLVGPGGEPAPGSLLAGKYRILEMLGRGGMGIVYKAEDTKLHRTVALKFLPPHLVRSEEWRERFLMEARAAAALSHPNICTIHEIYDQEERPFIEMEYVEGQNLRARIREGPLEPAEAIEIALQVAEGLEEAHRKGIIHRDIKSANIMVTGPASGRPGQVKVMDFGLAKVRGESLHTREGTTLGTVAYMSPEQARGEAVDQRTDVWSLGVVLYEMLSGRLPFTGERDTAILYSLAHAEPKPLKEVRPAVPVELDEIVRRALKKDLKARYGSAAEMGNDLKRYRESVKAAEMNVLTPRALWQAIRKPKIAIPLTVGLLVLCVAGWWFVERQGKIRWARETALPEIERLIEENDAWRNLTGAYSLAVRAEELIPGDPKLAGLMAKCSVRMNIKTEPPGAKVYMKEYKAPESDWHYLGATPIEKVRAPIGIFRWKFEKDGYEPVLAAASSWNFERGKGLVAFALARTLDQTGSIPSGMVRVEEAQTKGGKLPDFYIDRYEVTNKQYTDFINHGGYSNRKHWKHKFIKERTELSWDQAVKQFVDQSGQPGPATWQAGDYPEGQADFPVSGISWYEAAAYAEYAGKSLPTVEHWEVARGGYTPVIQWPQLGGFAVFAPFSNFGGKGPSAVGSLPGFTAYGAFDTAGNVREWCFNETPKGKAIRGGAWDDNTYVFGKLSQAPPMDRSARNGLRCAVYPELAKIPGSAFELAGLKEPRDYYSKKPVSDAVFQVYKEQFSYDKTDLKARVESRQDNPAGWIREKITFDAAHGGKRVIGHLFIPKNAAPPYQTVIYFPGSASVVQESSRDIESYYEFPMFLSFIVKNGRAVLYPVYKGTFERRYDAAAPIHGGDNSRLYSEYLVQVVKDLSRCIDYLETRQDVDSKKIAFYGMSWGAALGAIIPAVEERFKASILLGGGLTGRGRPEANQINYVTRVKTPTLMLNGRYDTLSVSETSQKPMFDLLGAADKQWKVYETDHIPPRNEYIKEILAWLDRHLGPVKRGVTESGGAHELFEVSDADPRHTRLPPGRPRT